MERLSSGKKINSAADDAAGFAIAERMTAQVRGLSMAMKNANDGLSLLSVAENRLSDVTEILQRVTELAVQASNRTNSAGDKTNLSIEANALIAEIDRIAAGTTFNGLRMLAGFSDQLDIQIGYNDGETVTIAIAGAYSSQLGIADGFGSAQAIDVLDQNDLTVSGSETLVDLSSYQNSHEKIGHVLNHDNWFGSSRGYGTPDSTYQSQNAFINFEDGSFFEVVTFFPDTGNANAAPTLKINATLAELSEKNGQKWDVTRGGVSAIDLVSLPSSGLTDIDIAIDQINTQKVELGAFQNRLAFVVSNLMNVAENTSAARSRIQDTDFPIETGGLAKSQVLRHTATAMLAHTNAQPQIVLSLIR